jgi:hypothetical protein
VTTRAELDARYQQLLAERDALAARYNAGEVQVITQIQNINTELTSVVQQLNAFDYPPVASSGTVQTAGSVARDEGATTQNPPPAPLIVKQDQVNQAVDIGPAPITTTPTNADSTAPQTAKEKQAPPTISGGNAPFVPASTSNGASATPAQNTGLLEPSQQSQATQSYIYKAIDVTHVFDRGRFTQEIHGALLVFPYPITDANESAAGNAKPTTDSQRQDSTNQTAPTSRATDVSASNTPLKKFAQPKINLSPTVSSKALGTSVTAGQSNALAAALNLPPTSGGQSVSPSFSEDVAARRQQLITTPQQINREP